MFLLVYEPSVEWKFLIIFYFIYLIMDRIKRWYASMKTSQDFKATTRYMKRYFIESAIKFPNKKNTLQKNVISKTLLIKFKWQSDVVTSALSSHQSILAQTSEAFKFDSLTS
jgi:hypothetical protein